MRVDVHTRGGESPIAALNWKIVWRGKKARTTMAATITITMAVSVASNPMLQHCTTRAIRWAALKRQQQGGIPPTPMPMVTSASALLRVAAKSAQHVFAIIAGMATSA